MKLKVETDPSSGFCNGVVRAVCKAEEYLRHHDGLYSLGAIVHNKVELERLTSQGLRILTIDEVRDLHDDTLLIRAHGEPPSTYALAAANNIKIIDCTCPVVLQLQKQVREVYEKKHSSGGQIVIFGKAGHAEVNGLVGQTDSTAIVVSGPDGISGIDFSRPVDLFSQTTKDPQEYAALCREFSARGSQVVCHDTICRQVASRHKSLVDFAAGHSLVLFVSGRESSNGKVLFDLCRSVNPRTWWVESPDDIDRSWFAAGDVVGVCGATSTPGWQLEEIGKFCLTLEV